MQLKDIKQLNDKSPVDGVKGTVVKQFPPTCPNENDIKFGQHRQSLLINDGEDESLLIVLMKEQIHINDPCEGQEIIISASVNGKGDARGLVFNTWQREGKQYSSTSVRVYPEATIRLVPAEENLA